MEVPLLLGVDGEARKHFIENAQAGFFFEPENHIDLIEKVNYLANNRSIINEMGINGRNYVNIHFNRNKIASDLLNKLSS